MLYFLRFWKVFDGNVWFYAGFKRFLQPNVMFPQVLKGFRWKRLIQCRFWKVFDAKCCISLGFERFLMEKFVLSKVLKGLSAKALSNRCSWKHLGAQSSQSS